MNSHERRVLAVLSALLSLTLILQAQASDPGNVALGKPVTLLGEYGVLIGPGWDPAEPVAPAETLVDGAFLPRGHTWQVDTVWWDARHAASANNAIEIDLLDMHHIVGLIVQADDNDSYRVDYWDGTAWFTAWDVPLVGGIGMQTRPNALDDSEVFRLDTPIDASKLRLTAVAGDRFYSFSEVQAFVRLVPEPASVVLVAITSLIGLARWGRRKSAASR